jgi:hypothetical protein
VLGNGIGAKHENNNVDLNVDLAEVRLISSGDTLFHFYHIHAYFFQRRII